MTDETVITDQDENSVTEYFTDEPATADGSDPKPKKRKIKLWLKIVIAIVAVFVVLGGGAGAAYAIFHDNPAFCNAICHTPMDPYVESYQEGTSINPLQADSEAVLSVVTHKDSDQQLNCLSCHVPDMQEQIQEGIKWVTGDYELPIEMKLVNGQVKEDSGDKNGVEFCLRADCHEGIGTDDPLKDLKGITADEHRNPHDSHLGNQDCSNCHQTHEQSVMMCSQCHADAKVPEGWLTYKEQQDQKKLAEQ
jgi:hypothetical protein